MAYKMQPPTVDIPTVNTDERTFVASDDIIGFEKAQRLLMIGGGCLLIVLIFGIILCRLDISAGRKRRALGFQQVEH